MTFIFSAEQVIAIGQSSTKFKTSAVGSMVTFVPMELDCVEERVVLKMSGVDEVEETGVGEVDFPGPSVSTDGVDFSRLIVLTRDPAVDFLGVVSG